MLVILWCLSHLNEEIYSAGDRDRNNLQREVNERRGTISRNATFVIIPLLILIIFAYDWLYSNIMIVVGANQEVTEVSPLKDRSCHGRTNVIGSACRKV